MGRSQSTFQKREKEKKRLQKRKQKAEKKELRKANSTSGDLDNMMVYVDDNGNLTDTPPEEKDATMEIDASQIEVSIPRSAAVDVDAERRGTVKFYNEEKGFGFIVQQGVLDQYFVHGSNVDGTIFDNDKVRFKIEKGEKGYNAIEVKKI
ncbi:MAG: cold shock domain-containing protein [Cytophagales bacterium]|nr:cold shock domain-containing protein [Cytophagales bacterium]